MQWKMGALYHQPGHSVTPLPQRSRERNRYLQVAGRTLFPRTCLIRRVSRIEEVKRKRSERKAEQKRKETLGKRLKCAGL